MTPPSVSFIIPIDKGAFSLAEPLEVTLWNTEQLAISAKNRQCFVNEEIHVGNSSSNVKPSEEIRCPEGIVYENYTSQEFTFALQDINSPIIITNTTIQVGEEYALSIYGLANDNCNMTSGHGNGIAHSNIITPDDMIWMTTLLECLDTP